MLRILSVLFVSLFILTACGKKKTGPDDGTQQPGAGSVTTPGGDSSPQPISMDPFEDPANPLSKRIIYFDYDSSQVHAEDIPIVNAHAKYLADNTGARVRLEGHADERGSREYNVALSERRALSVKRLMAFQGTRADQADIVAYGEERPVEFGHNEAAWSQNRRVEIIYESK
ncbi:MAG TPA: peptidoglycan-associated lipoprotein Pal [Chromatiales bacterium]|nr:peptidoglycan-associated lipoprotein Pal [Thiotrichales bacterium]HIP68025.1 peptidoglycan-associated lipoprotein Pal [Chromatiales bacterium]